MRFAAIPPLAVGFIFNVPAIAADSKQQKVDQIFAAYDKTGSPGCALGVIRDGNLIDRKGYGISNTNYFLLGEVVRRATMKSLAEFAAENMFQPLGMLHTRFYDDHAVVLPGRVAAYDSGGDGDFLVDWSTNS